MKRISLLLVPIFLLALPGFCRVLDEASVKIIRNPSGGVRFHFGYDLKAIPNGFLVGAPGEDKAYSFDLDGNLIHTLQSPAQSRDGDFGYSVGWVQGDYLVGDVTHRETTETIPNEGIVFRFDGETGIHQETVLPPFRGFPFFGTALRSIGGNYFVGHPGFGTTTQDSMGIVYLFDGDTNLPLRNFPNPKIEGSQFGQFLASTESLLIVGSPLESFEGTSLAGAVHLFDADPQSPHFGQLIETLRQPAPKLGDQFGIFVATDGKRLLAGMETQDTSHGKVFMFDIDPASQTFGDLLHTFENPRDLPNYIFPIMGAFIEGSILIGARGFPKGVIHVFDDETYAIKQHIESPDPPKGGSSSLDGFGQRIAVSGRKVIVAAPDNYVSKSNSGTVYIYDTKPDIEERIQFSCKELEVAFFEGLDLGIEIYTGDLDASCCDPINISSATPISKCRINFEFLFESPPFNTCEEVVDLLALEIGSCFDQVSGIIEWRAVSGGGLIVSSEDPFFIGFRSFEIRDLNDEEIIPLAECAISNLGDRHHGNELGEPFTSGFAVSGPRWKKPFYDANDDCFIDVTDLLRVLESGLPSIPDSTATFEDFSIYWYD